MRVGALTLEEKQQINALRVEGYSSAEIARKLHRARTTVRDEVKRQSRLKECGCNEDAREICDTCQRDPAEHVEGEQELGILTADDVSRITSLEDLITFFKVDTTVWDVERYVVNKWEQASGSEAKGGITVTPLYQVKANLVRKAIVSADVVKQVWDEFVADAAVHAPTYSPRIYLPPLREPVLLEVSIMDPHFGMLAWGKEVGEDYDVNIARENYSAAVAKLLRYANLYSVERILFLVGNDLLHVDGAALGTRGGSTTAGTQQDIDSRLAKMFTAARRAVVDGIDQARQLGPVDVLVVPGNHDRSKMYDMGEVLHAWYRSTDDVNVIYSPNVRKFYGYGDNAFMFTHGEEYNRTGRDQLPLIFATECPSELWVRGRHREIHTGHNHIRKVGRYVPTFDMDETRAIVTRSLPGLTATDAWHHENGYKHRRAATVLAFNRSGGLAGFHEFTL